MQTCGKSMGEQHQILTSALSSAWILAGAAAGGCNPWRLAQQDKHGSQAGDVGLDWGQALGKRSRDWAQHDGQLHVLAQQRRVFLLLIRWLSPTQYLKVKASRHGWVGWRICRNRKRVVHPIKVSRIQFARVVFYGCILWCQSYER